MGGRGLNLNECRLGVPLLTLVVGDGRVVLSYDQAEHRLWMIDVQGDSAGAIPVRGDYQETTLSKRRILGGSAPASATEVSVRSEGREPQKGLVKNGVWLAAAPRRRGHMVFRDEAGRLAGVLGFPASSPRRAVSRSGLPGFLRRRVVGVGTVTYGN
jgi:hypothetical protein